MDSSQAAALPQKPSPQNDNLVQRWWYGQMGQSKQPHIAYTRWLAVTQVMSGSRLQPFPALRTVLASIHVSMLLEWLHARARGLVEHKSYFGPYSWPNEKPLAD